MILAKSFLSPASSANRTLKPQVTTMAKRQPEASRFSVKEKGASSNASGGPCLQPQGAGDEGQGCADYPCPQSPPLHVHGLKVGAAEALAQLPSRTALRFSFPLPRTNGSIEPSSNLRAHKGTVVCVLWSKVRKREDRGGHKSAAVGL